MSRTIKIHLQQQKIIFRCCSYSLNLIISIILKKLCNIFQHIYKGTIEYLYIDYQLACRIKYRYAELCEVIYNL